MANTGFIQLRRGILEHLEDGRITPDECIAYVAMILKADHRTGVWIGSGIALAVIMHWKIRKGQLVLTALSSKRYISFHLEPGHRGNYEIKIARYFGCEKRPTRVRNKDKQKPLGCETGHASGCGTGPTIQEVKKEQEELLQEGAAAKPAAFVIPEWMPLEAWKDYEEMRRVIKRPMSPRARQMAVNKLAELHVLGHTPKAVLEQSIFNSWQGLFPIKEAGYGNRNQNDPNERLRQAARNIGYDPKMAN